MAPSSSTATTSVQVALRIRPPTTQDSTSIPARFQRSVIQATSPNSVSIEVSSSAPSGSGASASASVPSSGSAAKKQFFSFDQVHSPSTTQHALFTSTAEPLISRFVDGFNCTILAYGQTSSGKTFTMTGVDLDADPSDPNNGMGIIPRAVSTIFARARQLKEERGTAWNYNIKGSFIEIYNEDLIDLLSLDEGGGGRREVQIREDKDGHIIWGGLREIGVKNPGEVMNLIRQGTSIRRTNETDMNAQSSRSHAIFSLTLTQKKYTGSTPPPRSSSPLPPGGGRSPSRLVRPGSMYAGPTTTTRMGSPTFGRPSTPSFVSAIGRGGSLRPASVMGHPSESRLNPANAGDDESGKWVTIVSKFHFVDLAGSERLKRTAAAGERIKEGISINSGLLALGNVISALGDPSRAKSNTATHIPYRDSKLTRLLQDSLGGNAHTLMIACVSPAEWNAAETVNTLKYANRARNIKNRAVVNEKEDGWDDVEWLQGTVTRLRKELKIIKEGGTIPADTHRPPEVIEGAGKRVLAQLTALQNNYEDLREKFVERTEELTRLRRDLGEKHRGSTAGAVGGTAKYEEIVGPVIEEYEKTIAAMEAELTLNRAALRHTNEMVEEKEDELAAITERHAATELYVEELRTRVAKLTEREASTEAYVRDLEEKMKSYDETSVTSSESMTDLKREVARFRDTESHSSHYISDLESRLARSDESIITLQQTIQHLEAESERRRDEVELLQSRLTALKQDGDNWRTDLEARERKVKELEQKMEEWEKKKQDVGETRARLGNVVGEVSQARRSLEIDLASASTLSNGASPISATPSPVSNSVASPLTGATTPDPSIETQLIALQQTHTATLADLSSVTAKYRDALREISDLAAQIQEAKLSNPDIPESATVDKPVEIPPFRRRMTGGRSREVSGDSPVSSPGRRLFFRQAASAESLHSRSLSQSLSLSQELSSARLRKASISSHGTSSSHSSHSPSNSYSVPSQSLHRPNLSITMPHSAIGIETSTTGRSVTSLENEIMRLQEVLKERESEITLLEASLKESKSASAATSTLANEETAPYTNGASNHHAFNGEEHLSPKTLHQFDRIRGALEHDHNNLENGSEVNGSVAESVSEADESLDRLNELMLSMAQKESHHREVVDNLNRQLTQVRRQHEDLTMLNRDQAINMSTELEALRSKHDDDLARLEEVQAREADLVKQLEQANTDHAVAVERLRAEHEAALTAKGVEVEQLIASLKEEHEASLTALREELKAATTRGADAERLVEQLKEEHTTALNSLRDELSAASTALEKAHKDHEDAFGKLKADHGAEVNRQVEEARGALDTARQEHEATIKKLSNVHAEAMKEKDAETTASIQRTEEEYYEALTKLRRDHAQALEVHAAEATATLERLREEHAGEMRMAEIARDSLSESASTNSVALQDLQAEHSAAIARKEASFNEELEKIKAEHARALVTKDEDYALEVRKRNVAYEDTVTKLRDEWRAEVEALNATLAARKEEAENSSKKLAEEWQAKEQQLNAALAASKEESTASLASLQTEYQTKEEELKSALTATKEDSAAISVKLKEEWKAEVERLQQELSAHKDEASASSMKAREELEAAVQAAQERQALVLQEITSAHEEETLNLKSAHEVALAEAAVAAEQLRTSLVQSHTEELAKLRAEHQQAIAAVNADLIDLQEKHREDLEESRVRSENLVAEERERLAASLEDLKQQHLAEVETLRMDHDLLHSELESYKSAADQVSVTEEAVRQAREETRQAQEEAHQAQDEVRQAQEQSRQAQEQALKAQAEARKAHEASLSAQVLATQSAEEALSSISSERDNLAAEVARLREELDHTRSEQSKLLQEASKRDSLVDELEKHRSVLAEMQENLQRVKDEKDNLQLEKTRQESMVRELQAQVARSSTPPGTRPAPLDRNVSYNRSTALPPMKLPPQAPPPAVPIPSPPRTTHVVEVSSSSQSSSVGPSLASIRDAPPESPTTSMSNSGTPTPLDPKVSARLDQQAKYIDEQDVMIKTLNKQLTHCESDLQTHMDLVSTLETSLGDSEKNLRKARMHATELARERDILNGKVDSLQKELQEAKREVVTVRKSIVEEKQSLEQRLDEERKAKERARAQLDIRMDDLQKRKSKFACL